jgi:hypothetical protein
MYLGGVIGTRLAMLPRKKKPKLTDGYMMLTLQWVQRMGMMTVDRLSELEEATLHQLENDIKVSFWVMVDRMAQIERERLYRGEHPTFSDWLLKRYPELTSNGKGISETTWRQWKASAKVYELAKTNGVELANEHAARALRSHGLEDSLRVLVINQTVKYEEMKTGERPAQLTAAMIKPVMDEIKDVIDTAAITGYVDTGDGEMSGFAVAVNLALQERTLRRNQRIIEGAKKRGGWSESKEVDHYWEGETIWFTLNGRDHNIPEGGEFQIRWRLVEEPDPESEPIEGTIN